MPSNIQTIVYLTFCATYLYLRLKHSNQLETSLQNAKTLLSSYENKLAREEVAPSDISSLEKTQRELGVRWLFQTVEHITMRSTLKWKGKNPKSLISRRVMNHHTVAGLHSLWSWL